MEQTLKTLISDKELKAETEGSSPLPPAWPRPSRHSSGLGNRSSECSLSWCYLHSFTQFKFLVPAWLTQREGFPGKEGSLGRTSQEVILPRGTDQLGGTSLLSGGGDLRLPSTWEKNGGKARGTDPGGEGAGAD